MSGLVRIDPVHSLRPDQLLVLEVTVWLALFFFALLAWHVGIGLAVAGSGRLRRRAGGAS